MRPEHPLERLDRELRAPPRRRLALLEELKADTEGLERELVRRGRHPRQAREAAIQSLVPEGQALALLEAQNAPLLGRLVQAAGRLERVERIGTAAASILAGMSAVLVIRSPGSLGVTAVLAWPQVVVVALLAGNWARAAFQLWVRGDLRPPLRRSLWRRQIGLMVAAVALGALGAAWEGYLALGALDPGSGSAPALWGTLRRALGFGSLGLAAATLGLFGWLALMPRLITDEAIERRISRLFSRRRPEVGPPSPTETGRK